MDSEILPRRPRQSALFPAFASLLVPGLGQVVMGQWVRGASLFVASAFLCFGMGLCNLVVAYDAYSVARQLRDGDITTATESGLMSRLWFVYEWIRFVRSTFRLFFR